jgi:hypothetical protein
MDATHGENGQFSLPGVPARRVEEGAFKLGEPKEAPDAGSAERRWGVSHHKCLAIGNYIFDLGNDLCHARFNGDGTNDIRSF